MANPFHDTSFDTPAEQISALKDELSAALSLIRSFREAGGDVLDHLDELDTTLLSHDKYRGIMSLKSNMHDLRVSYNEAGTMLHQHDEPDEDDGVEHGMSLTHHG